MPETFQSIFFPGSPAPHLRVPDYQRAYSWEQKQVDLFIADLVKYGDPNLKYYFGHFIVETPPPPGAQAEAAAPAQRAAQADEKQPPCWEIVDGQQRLTTLVLFLRVCQFLVSVEKLAPDLETQLAFSLIGRFHTVSYDRDALRCMDAHLTEFFQHPDVAEKSKEPADDIICTTLGLDKEKFTHSQKRMALALRRFYQAFGEKGVRPESGPKGELRLQPGGIPAYIRMLLGAHCSCHPTQDKSVAVHIFEMHNTRGVPLTPLEVLKAKLMKFVHDSSEPGPGREDSVRRIQHHFGRIYAMEERLARASFRGQMTMLQLLHLHLQVVDDGRKALPPADESARQSQEHDLRVPSYSASTEDLIAYVETSLLHHWKDGRVAADKPAPQGVTYALDLAAELEKSVRIVSHTLPAWDALEPLVGDVLILERQLSCQFFLIACRRLGLDAAAEPHYGRALLQLWERLLFTRDFHGAYYRKSYRDNFPQLLTRLGTTLESMQHALQPYLQDGFRPNDGTRGLPGVVAAYMKLHKDDMLQNAYGWWQEKLKYLLYKYEVTPAEKEGLGRDKHIRRVMKGTISVEHILPQNWREMQSSLKPGKVLDSMPAAEQEGFIRRINQTINGLGNLLLLMPHENSHESDKHPAEKTYSKHLAGSYAQHRTHHAAWYDSSQWDALIQKRGEEIYQFMLTHFQLPAVESEPAP